VESPLRVSRTHEQRALEEGRFNALGSARIQVLLPCTEPVRKKTRARGRSSALGSARMRIVRTTRSGSFKITIWRSAKRLEEYGTQRCWMEARSRTVDGMQAAPASAPARCRAGWQGRARPGERIRPAYLGVVIGRRACGAPIPCPSPPPWVQSASRRRAPGALPSMPLWWPTYTPDSRGAALRAAERGLRADCAQGDDRMPHRLT
jgi:hypothetical protein